MIPAVFHPRRKLESLLSVSFAALFFQSSNLQAAASFFSLGYNKMHTTFRDNSSGLITISPKDAKTQSALVVICHGLGDSAEGFADVAEVRFTRI
jgi:poly(3-hydroxybutyrate) depolymerase